MKKAPYLLLCCEFMQADLGPDIACAAIKGREDTGIY